MHLTSYALTLCNCEDVAEVNARTFKLQELKQVDLTGYVQKNECTEDGVITEMSGESDIYWNFLFT